MRTETFPICGQKSLTIVLLLIGLSACALRAAIIGHEAFDYPSGTYAGQAGGTYWDWNNVVPTGHTGASATWDNLGGFVTAMVSNNTLVTTGTAAAKREFSADEMAGAFRGSGVIYFKVTMKRDANVESSGLSSYDFGSERIFFGVPAALKDGQRKFAIQIIDGSLSDDDYSWTNIVAAADHDYTLVAKLDFNLDMLTLYVDPVLARPESANSFAQGIARLYTGGNWSTAVRLASSGAGTTTWDNLVVATTWEELALKSSLQAGLTAYWPFEDTLEDMADELPATANSVADNGTFMGPATDTGFAVGKFGRCYQSNGGSGYISVPFSADTTGVANGSSGFSFSAWFRADALDTSFQTLVAQGENTRWRVARYGTTANMSYAGGAPGVQDIQSTTSFTPPTGWMHLVAVTQTGVATRLYINGTLESTNPSPPVISHDGLSNLFIGANPNATGREWSGAIDDVALWNRPLSADEIATLFAAGQSGQSLARLAANTLTVTTIADELHSPAGTQLSLREAIRDAARGDIIQFDSALNNKTITLGGTRLTLDKSLTLDADALYGLIYISGSNWTPVFEITAGKHLVALRSLAIIRGNAVSGLGGGIINHGHLTANTCYLMDNAANNGAGLWNDGILTMTDVWLVRNQGQASGGGIYNQGALTVVRANIGDNQASASGYGGGIYNTGSLTLTRSTVSGNDAYSGGGIYNTGTMNLDHVTLATNTATYGGAICNSGSGPVTLSHNTLSNNYASAGGGIYDMSSGAHYLLLSHTLIAANPSGGDLYLAANPAVRQGVNLIGGNGACATSFPAGLPNANGDFVGTAAVLLDPKLMPLNNYGGTRETMPPRPGSPAMDRITPTAEMLADSDQRGLPRVLWGKADIGAAEFGVAAEYTWEVREIFRNPAIALSTLAAVETLIADPAATTITSQAAVINRADPETTPSSGGYFGGDEPFTSNNLTPQGLINGDDNDFAMVARCFIEIQTEGDYTFGFSSNEGARLRVFGATFTSSTRLNTANPSNPAHSGDTLTYSGLTDNSHTLGVCHLIPGVYPVEFLTWERSAGAYAEVFLARGARTFVDQNFRLIGDYTSSGRSPGSLSAPWSVVAIRDNAANLTTAVAQVYAHWTGEPQPNTSIATANVINYRDPENGGGGHAGTQYPFPGNLVTDDNYFALGASAKLSPYFRGYHTFCIQGDNGFRFRIKGTRGWSVSSPDATQTLPKPLVDGIQSDAGGGDVFGQVYLETGRSYEMELIYHEATGGAYVGLWGASGKHSVFSTGVFSPVGSGLINQADYPCMLTNQPGVSSQPLNNNFANPFILTGPVAHGKGSNMNATMEIGEPDSNRGSSIWWQWKAPSSGLVQVDTIGTDFDTTLAAYSGTWSNLIQLGLNDNWLGSASLLTFNATAGTIYYFQMSTTGSTGGSGRPVYINLGPVVPPPANDNFNSPSALGTASPLSVSGSNLYASAQAGEPGHWPGGGFTTPVASVWYSWTAPYSGDFHIDASGSGVPPLVAVYVGSGTSFSDWRQVAATAAGVITLSATAGTTYRIVIEGSLLVRGDYVLNLSPVPQILSHSLTSTDHDRSFALNWRSEPWTTYQIQSSQDLVGWDDLRTVYANGSTATTALNAIPTSIPKYFFRVVRE